MSESDIQREILEFLLKHPKVAIVWKNDSNKKKSQKFGGGKYRPKGLPDIAGIFRGGRAFLFEIKTPIGKCSPEQTDFIERANQCGAYACVLRSLDDAVKAIDLA